MKLFSFSKFVLKSFEISSIILVQTDIGRSSCR